MPARHSLIMHSPLYRRLFLALLFLGILLLRAVSAFPLNGEPGTGKIAEGDAFPTFSPAPVLSLEEKGIVPDETPAPPDKPVAIAPENNGANDPPADYAPDAPTDAPPAPPDEPGEVKEDETPAAAQEPGAAPPDDSEPNAGTEAVPAQIETPQESVNPAAHEEELRREREEAEKKAQEEALQREREAAQKKAREEAERKEKEARLNKRIADAADAATAGDWERLISAAPDIIAEGPELNAKFTPLLAYAYYMTGDMGRTAEALKASDDAYSALTRSVITGEKTTVPGSKTEITGVKIFAVKIGVPQTEGFETIVYKKSLLKALKEAFKKTAGDAAKYGPGAFEKYIAPSAERYYVNHYVLSQDEDGGDSFDFNVVMFIDTGRLKEAVDALGAGNGEAGQQRHMKTILLSKKGAETVKKSLLADLMKDGFPVEDLGSGALTPETVNKAKGAIIIQIDVESASSGKLLNSNFKSIRANLDFTIINGNNGLVISKLSKSHALVHLNEEEGKEAAVQKAYEKSAGPLKDAITDIEMRMGKDIASGLLPSVEASLRDVKEVFANIYKSYADDTIGTLILKNNTDNEFKSIRAAFSIKGYMDYPTERVIDRLGPREEKAVPVKAVFNNNVLNLTDNTLLQSELEVRYAESGGEEKTIRVRQPIQMYEKHALVWDDKGKVASFITYKDPVVDGFAAKAAREYNYPYLPQAIVTARAIFGAMGALGITYVPDPVPYSTVASITSMVDHVQYPRQTLARKAGDCDDLVALMTASLEALGIKAMPVEAPGHLFLMFDTGISRDNEAEFGFPRDMYVIYGSTIWLPFETTLVGSNFFLAWEKGAENYRKWSDEVKPVDLKKAWKTYAPATLPPDEFTQPVSMAAIDRKFPNELDAIKRRRVEGIVKKSVKGKGRDEKKEAIILYGKNGMVSEAIKLAEEMLKNGGKRDPGILNNAGNLYYLNGDYERALKSYLEAGKLAPDDPRILVNEARAYLKLGQTKKAADAFDKAVDIAPDMKDEYMRLHTEISK
ncbi:MAG: tetratricopeptide repeat protein [Deltaproteobacteria bacterium]|nr:tetratricopeptide repeat protein [Deltaproteobacteria bacterium]